MKPYYQGALDGLCGVYSIINAVRIVNDIDDQDGEDLFKAIIAYLDREKNLSKIITDGLSILVIGEILKNVKELNIAREKPFHGLGETGLPEFWSSMQEFLSLPNRSMLLGLGGVHDHWSVIEKISDKRITFLDSDGIKHIDRGKCTTQEPDKKRIHHIYPTHTYFLSSTT